MTEGFAGSFVCQFNHGLLVVEGPHSEASHDDWDPGTEMVHLDGDSLYIGVQPAVDGHVAVAVYRDVSPVAAMEGLSEAFSGVLELQAGQLRFSDAAHANSMTVRGVPTKCRLSAWVDDPNFPSRVVIVTSHVEDSPAKSVAADT